MRRVGYIGEGAFSQRLPYADFFGYFLVRRQESNIPHIPLQKCMQYRTPLHRSDPCDAVDFSPKYGYTYP